MRLLLPVMLCLLAAGCSVSQRIDKAGEEVVKVYDSLPDWEELPVKRITWNQAVDMAMEKNIELRRSRNSIKQSEREVRSVYTDLIPGFNLYATMTEAVRDISYSPNSENMTYNINVLFNLPSISQLPYRVYSAQAQLFGIKKTYELKQREITAKIYQHVRNEELDHQLHELDRAAQTKEERESTAQIKEEEWRSGRIDAWSKLAALLGSQEARWEIIPETLPKLDQARYEREYVHLDPLVVTQYAMQLEAARMRKYQILMNYLPQINLNLYSPSLFSSTGGTYGGTFLDSSDMQLTTNASLSIDTKLTNWDQFRTAEEEYEFTKEEMRTKLMDRRIQVGKVLKSCREFETWKSAIASRIDFQSKQPVSSAEELLEKRKANIEMEREILNQEKRKIEGEAALMIEYGIFSL